MTGIMIILNIILALLCVVSVRHVMREKKKCIFIYPWTFPIYAFVWEDLAIIAFFFLILLDIAFFAHDIRIAILGTLFFYCVRSAGETLYYFLQQFLQPTHHPHDIDYHFEGMRKLLGPISYQKALIIMQVLHQITLVFALTLVALTILKWTTLPTWW